jgi:hypothetical protein
MTAWVRISERDIREAPEVRNWIFAYSAMALLRFFIGESWLGWYRDQDGGMALKWTWVTDTKP